MSEIMNDTNQIQDLKKILYKIILNEIFQKKENLYNQYPADYLEKLKNTGLIRKIVSLDGEVVQIEPWLKTRIFEEVVASEGIDIYLNDLLNYGGKDAYKAVKLNYCFAASHLASSINKFVFQLLVNLNEKNLLFSEKEKITIGNVLNPNKNYTLNISEIKFDYDLIEDLRLKIQEYIYNYVDLTEKRRRGKQIKKSNYYLEIPDDIIIIEALENFNYNDIMEVAKPLIADEMLKICLFKGTIVWMKEDRPNIYIKNGKIGYSPSVNALKDFSKEDVIEEIKFIKNIIYKYKTVEFKQNIVPCYSCGQKADRMAYHNLKGVVLVCEQCFDKPEIKALIEAKIIMK